MLLILILKLELKEVLKKKKESRFEFKESSFHQKVSIGFKKLGKKKKVKIFNGDKSKNEIHKNIVDFLNKQRILKNKFHTIMITDYDIIKKSYLSEFNFITKLYLKETFPHSWIFHGPKESGKRKFLDIFIKSIYKKLNIDQFVFEINSDENIALVDDVRNFINQCNLTNSVENINKSFLVINNLELLNKNSVVALLKTLEEPPPNTILILITHNLKLIPKTIQSRCVKIKFNPHKLLASKYEYKSEQENLLISNGSPSIYNLLQSNDGNLIKGEIMKILESKNLNI